MNALIRCRLRGRCFNLCRDRPFFLREASSSSENAEKSSIEKTLRERDRTQEPRITKGEVFSRANIAPQIYETSYEDNFQRTTVEDIASEMREAKRNYIGRYNEVGFVLADETMLIGPIAVFPKTVLSWRVKDVDDISTDSMLLFTIVEPKLEIVVVGVGDKKNIRPVKERLQPLFRKHNILVEVLDTPDACSTFNFLNKDGRYVAAALFPALEVVPEKGNTRVPLKDLDTMRRGWFGLGYYDSKNPLDDAKMRIEDAARRRREKEGLAEEEKELSEKRDKP